MRQIHRAGEKLFVDFPRSTLALADDSRADIFVAALGASSYTFACATPRETMADWLQGCAQALDYIGGVPLLIAPDNTRAMIARLDRYEPQPNDTVQDFASHYGTSVLPAHTRHPKDKAKVESAVHRTGNVTDIGGHVRLEPSVTIDRNDRSRWAGIPSYLAALPEALP